MGDGQRQRSINAYHYYMSRVRNLERRGLPIPKLRDIFPNESMYQDYKVGWMII